MTKKQRKKKFIKEIKNTSNISFTCKIVGISRDTFYRWKKEDKNFAMDVAEGIEIGLNNMSDLAESQLFTNIKQGRERSIEFFLKNNNPRYSKSAEEKANYYRDMFNLFYEDNMRLLKFIEDELKLDASGVVDLNRSQGDSYLRTSSIVSN